jgi:mRNA interferase RelE/StbE
VAKFEISFRPSVAKDTKGIPAEDLKRILERIDSLADEPRPPGSIKLSGRDYYRIRQGNYRIIYEIVENRLVIVVIKIGHRRDVYQ